MRLGTDQICAINLIDNYKEMSNGSYQKRKWLISNRISFLDMTDIQVHYLSEFFAVCDAWCTSEVLLVLKYIESHMYWHYIVWFYSFSAVFRALFRKILYLMLIKSVKKYFLQSKKQKSRASGSHFLWKIPGFGQIQW